MMGEIMLGVLWLLECVWAQSVEELLVGHSQGTSFILLGGKLVEDLLWGSKESDLVLFVSKSIFRSGRSSTLSIFVFLHEKICSESQSWENELHVAV